MRTRRARDASARPTITRRNVVESGRPFRVNNVSSTRLGDVLEDYVMAHRTEGLSVSGELFFQPVPNESNSSRGHLSVDTAWQLKLEQAAETSKQLIDEEDEVPFDLFQQAIENYRYHLKRNLVKIRG